MNDKTPPVLYSSFFWFQESLSTEFLVEHNTGFRITCMAVYPPNNSKLTGKSDSASTTESKQTKKTDVTPDSDQDDGVGDDEVESDDEEESDDVEEPVQPKQPITNKRKHQVESDSLVSKKKQRMKKQEMEKKKVTINVPTLKGKANKNQGKFNVSSTYLYG